MDPEELFRRIFGSAGMGGFGFSSQDFEESMHGFAPASEVTNNNVGGDCKTFCLL